MNFFDCNAFIGRPAHRDIYPPVAGAADLLAEMDFCGVERSLIWHIAQMEASAPTGNALLAESIKGQPRLQGCWAILPNQAREFPPFDVFLEQMRQAQVTALRTFPLNHHFTLNRLSLASWLEPAEAHRIPVFISVRWGASWDMVYTLLAECPDLVCVICDHGCWGEDRHFRPLIERYPNVYIDTALYMLDGGIEAFVADYGPERMLFGSGFPTGYLGGMMLAIQHAQISTAAREAIAGKNLERILAEVQW